MAMRAELGLARSPGITYQELLDTDTHPVPDVLRLASPRYLGTADIPIERYTSRAWHELRGRAAVEAGLAVRLPRRADPAPGDYIVYEIANLSFIVMRTPVGSHQGVPQRVPAPRPAAEGLRRSLLARSAARSTASPGPSTAPCTTCRPGGTSRTSTTDEFPLPEAKVGTWAGFVFINPDPNAEPFDELHRRAGRAVRRCGTSRTATSRPTSPR